MPITSDGLYCIASAVHCTEQNKYLYDAICLSADHSGRAVEGINCLHLLQHWHHRFESHLRHGYLYVRLFCVCVVMCIGSGLTKG
jgi:hypothetical protein